ncbi:MAG: hypothetical protein PHQ90_01590 [Sulfuricurvum sp.]|nr:hypothetical protein [Sulfuricurvum sp.]MDD2367962.1 hypothetical protein [Sulfuricurvum sp.]MDD2949161.1 hypothetical protein [Sulfuricurvum sp.]MDD5118768.1 hypothetical protein [Sulfuricurvum sp.]
MESLMISAIALVWLTIKVKEIQTQEGIYDAIKTLTFKFIA